MTRPIPAQDPSREKQIQAHYKNTQSMNPLEGYHYSSHYSNSVIVLYYLIRLPPFAFSFKVTMITVSSFPSTYFLSVDIFSLGSDNIRSRLSKISNGLPQNWNRSPKVSTINLELLSRTEECYISRTPREARWSWFSWLFFSQRLLYKNSLLFIDFLNDKILHVWPKLRGWNNIKLFLECMWVVLKCFLSLGESFSVSYAKGSTVNRDFWTFFFSKIVIWNFIFIYWFFEWQNFTCVTKIKRMKQHKAFLGMYVSCFEVFSSFGREFLGLVRQGKHEFLDFFFLENSYIKFFFYLMIFWMTKFYIYDQSLEDETT